MSTKNDEPTIERLLELLEAKDAEIEEMQQTINEQNIQLEQNHIWTQHDKLEESDMPVPRLELRYSVKDKEARFPWDDTIIIYALVYRHLLGHIVQVPLGRTEMNGSACLTEIPMNKRTDKPQMPFRDGAHILNDAEQLKLPMYAVVGDKFWPLTDKDR